MTVAGLLLCYNSREFFRENNFMEKTVDDFIEEKISEMEAKDYEFPKRMTKGDYIFTAVVIVVSLAVVIWGAFL